MRRDGGKKKHHLAEASTKHSFALTVNKSDVGGWGGGINLSMPVMGISQQDPKAVLGRWLGVGFTHTITILSTSPEINNPTVFAESLIRVAFGCYWLFLV